MASEWVWVGVEAALAAHRVQIAEHGGGDGIRDESLLESAMSRPRNLVSYGEPDAASLAASYAFGIARNHPFVDGNKRTAAVVSEAFLNFTPSKYFRAMRSTCSGETLPTHENTILSVLRFFLKKERKSFF